MFTEDCSNTIIKIEGAQPFFKLVHFVRGSPVCVRLLAPDAWTRHRHAVKTDLQSTQASEHNISFSLLLLFIPYIDEYNKSQEISSAYQKMINFHPFWQRCSHSINFHSVETEKRSLILGLGFAFIHFQD